MKFTLEIEIGNDGVRTPTMVGVLLARTGAELIEAQDDGKDEGIIRDINGNSVGYWRVIND